jgi:ankyrin repeat protein
VSEDTPCRCSSWLWAHSRHPGFKSLATATILNDVVWYPDTLDLKSFLVYYISRPLLGSWEEVKIPAALAPALGTGLGEVHDARALVPASPAPRNEGPRKKQIVSFHDLLDAFPIIARQMQPGLDALFQEFNAVFQGQLPPPLASPLPELASVGPVAASVRRSLVNGRSSEEDGEDHAMRAALEAGVNRAIELFQSVESQQLSMLGTTTELTGREVEKLLERYVAENVHHLIFPRLSALKRQDDLELEAKIRQMQFIDINQLGIALQDWPQGKRALIAKLDMAVSEFRKMSSALGPQQSLGVLLSTMKAISQVTEMAGQAGQVDDSGNPDGQPTAAGAGLPRAEKAPMTLNADTLVSLLLYVIIQSQAKHLEARMIYIRHYIFTEDVDSGEMGYALSTFEAVLTYLVTDSSTLRRASRRNRALWDAVAQADTSQLKSILEPSSDPSTFMVARGDLPLESSSSSSPSPSPPSSGGWSFANGTSVPRRLSSAWTSSERFSLGSDLSHVFPFQVGDMGVGSDSPVPPLPRTKRVVMDTRSMSSSSEISFRSRAPSTGTIGSGIEGDTSVERLCQTQNSLGESVLMMAVQNQREDSLRYLLSLRDQFSPQTVLADTTNDGTSLLSAAVQLGGRPVLELLVEYLFASRASADPRMQSLRAYVARQDSQGRSVAHYMFHAPFLLRRMGKMLPWRQRDKNGQTPLFALCRSYDHTSYREMVGEALTLAEEAQSDKLPLHLDDHKDSKGNTLLHIVNDAALVTRILAACDVDVNATNDRMFTPLMVASKYGRFDLVRLLYRDPRVDVAAKELRGLTAVELAKDDEVRNKIDDLALFAMPPLAGARTTGVVRAYFVEDASVRFVLKSGAPADQRSYTVTTCRRSLAEFELLTRLLAAENPASWIPSMADLRSATQIPSKPSRAVLRELQTKMNWLLHVLLMHPTFATHEMLWEFFLVPDLQTSQMEQRSKLKAQLRAEKIREETEPLDDVRDVERFVDHARDMVRGLHSSTRSVARRAAAMNNAANGTDLPSLPCNGPRPTDLELPPTTDLHEASDLLSQSLNNLHFLPEAHRTAFQTYADSLSEPQQSSRASFHASFMAIFGTSEALLEALARPQKLISHMAVCRREAERQSGSLSRSNRWPLGLLDDARQRAQDEREERARRSLAEADVMAKELRRSQQVVAGELADWQNMHERMGRRAIRDLARGMVTAETVRLEGIHRALRRLQGIPSDELQH